MSTAKKQGTAKKTRTHHHKSRMGCLECKRRRVKCDEAKPSCTRCNLGLLKCNYPSTTPLPGQERTYEFIVTSSGTSSSPPPKSSSSRPDHAVSLEASLYPEEVSLAMDDSLFMDIQTSGLSDVELYDYYHTHTRHTLCLCPSDQPVFYQGMPKIAQQCQTVMHALLAVAAADKAWTMISNDEAADFGTVTQVLLTGYQHYNQASEQMRDAILTPGGFEPESLVASTLMLIPFATASQQVNHWLSSRSGLTGTHKPLSSTPRDVIVIMRGVQTMLQSIACAQSTSTIDSSMDMNEDLYQYGMAEDTPSFELPPPSRSHLMSAIVITTSRAAFKGLQQRLDSALLHDQNSSYLSLLACTAAFENLKMIRKTAFDPETWDSSPWASPPSGLPSPGMDFGGPEIASASSIAPWLRSFAAQFCVASSATLQPNEPLTRFFLSFYIQAPQEYLDVVLPLLDQRLESPIDSQSAGVLSELDQTQAFALDIYAHWSVLMILVEEESWWIGSLPEVTLAGMLNRFGDKFVRRLWPENESAKEEWWPGKMLGILQDIRKYR